LAEVSFLTFSTDTKPKNEDEDDDTVWEELLPRPTVLKTTVYASDAYVPKMDLNSGEQLRYCNGQLYWSAGLIKQAFEKTVDPIKAHITQLCSTTPTLGTVFAVGGLCASPLVQHALLDCVHYVNGALRGFDKKDKKTHTREIQIVFPSKPTTSVIVGAALYGLNPDSIRSRVMRHTIGCDRAIEWTDPTHVIVPGKCHKIPREYRDPFSKKIIHDVICMNHFKPLILAGDIVTIFEQHSDTCYPAEPAQTEMHLRFFTTPNKVCNRIDEPGVEFLGRVQLEMPVCNNDMQRQVMYSVACGGTEFGIVARDCESGKSIKTTVSFLD
jgi:hypothetical protein